MAVVVATALWTSVWPPLHRPSALVCFRSTSRNTFGFQESFAALRYDELKAHAPGVRLLSADKASDLLWWAKDVDLEVLTAAARRSVLVHGVYRILARAPTAKGFRGLSVRGLSAADVLHLGNPNLRSSEARDLVETIRDGGCSSSEVQDVAAPGLRVIVGFDGVLYLGSVEARGMVAGPRGPGSTARRPRTSLLRRYALRSRPFRSETAMEPELGFLMASLARVGPGTAVLDPFCGSAGILLCCAALGARRVVGMDKDAAVLPGALLNFGHYGLPPPEIVHGDILNDAGSFPACFDAIVSDLPYGIRPSFGVEGVDAVDRAREGVVRLGTALVRLAERALVSSGRLVFFLPVRGSAPANTSAQAALEEYAPCLHQSSELRIVSTHMQVFSLTFVRWLVVAEKSGGTS